MDRDVDIKSAIAVILFFVCLIAAWAYFNTQALLVDSPSFVKQNPNGNLFVQIGSEYYEVNSDGVDIHHFSLSSVGVSTTIGDFDFFNNGDILIYATDHQPGFKQNLDTFTRSAGTNTREAGNKEGFYRCDVYKGVCERFGIDLPVFSRGFRIAVDIHDNVYIADTSRHLLLKVNSEGEQVASMVSGLKFPNDIYWQNDILSIVNTNHHEVMSVDAKTESFGAKLENFDVSLPGRRFPSDFEKIDSGWLVLVMDNSMQKGKLAQFNSSGERLSIIKLERGADLIGVIDNGRHIVLPDVENLRFRRISKSNFEELSDFTSQKLEVHLAESRETASFYNLIGWSLVGVGVLGFLALAFVAIKSEVKAIETEVQAINDDVSLDADMPDGVEVYWIPMSAQFTKSVKAMRWALPVCMILLVIFTTMVVIEESSSYLLFGPIGIMLGMMYFVGRLLKKTSEMALGISSDGLLIRDHLGNTFSGKGSEISMSNSSIVLGDAVVVKKLFDIDEYQKWVVPRLRNARDIGEVQVLIKQWKIKHPAFIEPLYICCVALLGMAIIEIAG